MWSFVFVNQITVFYLETIYQLSPKGLADNLCPYTLTTVMKNFTLHSRTSLCRLVMVVLLQLLRGVGVGGNRGRDLHQNWERQRVTFYILILCCTESWRPKRARRLKNSQMNGNFENTSIPGVALLLSWGVLHLHRHDIPICRRVSASCRQTLGKLCHYAGISRSVLFGMSTNSSNYCVYTSHYRTYSHANFLYKSFNCGSH